MKPNKRIRIRKITCKDATDYAKIAWDSSLRRFLRPFAVRNVDEAEALIQRETKLISPTMLAIFYRDTLVGAMTVSFYEDEATISYFIGKQYRNRGYAAASLSVLSEILKQKHPEIKKLAFSIRKENTASLQLQESIGSVRVREDEKHFQYVYRLSW